MMAAQPADFGRDRVLESLRRELVGPDAVGQPLTLSPVPRFASREDSYGPWIDAESGQEILTRDGPSTRYGVGVLYPAETQFADPAGQADSPGDDIAAPGSDDIAPTGAALEQLRGRGGEADADDFDLTAANRYRPSAMAVSFLARLPEGATLTVSARCGRYDPFPVEVADKRPAPSTDEVAYGRRTWWVRRPAVLEATFSAEALLGPAQPHTVLATDQQTSGLGQIEARIEVFSRPQGPETSLITVALVNRSREGGADASSLFQTTLAAQVATSATACILPYPDQTSQLLLETDAEERSMALLYQSAPVFAVGHGCAADWSARWGQASVSSVTGEPLPAVDTPTVTPTILAADGTELSVPMAALGGLDGQLAAGWSACEQVVAEYERWIREREAEAASLSGVLRRAAQEHLAACRQVAERMRAGLAWVQSDSTARRAFQLANRAVLYQQVRSELPTRATTLTKEGTFTVEGPHPKADWAKVPGRGKWRPFQIAFLLYTARSTVCGDDPSRSEVELIFFPTGGGKTEAYLGLAAFALFYQRLERDPSPGVGVLMRYTLRLLTAQQFLRASALVCAMEAIRSDERRAGLEDLGDQRFAIGIWVGQSATPLRRQEARTALRALQKNAKEANPFLLLRCPWCAAQLGPVKAEKGVRREASRIAGYRETNGTVGYRCPDRECRFGGGDSSLPVWVIDEDVYQERPSIVIGTIDKFAMLAWKPEARQLFGLMPDGSRGSRPPNLIIQDELHLISGPLGSMAGLYETLIEDLCTDERVEPARKPKIVCSTATIRRYRAQIKALYNRQDATLFPPFGLDASDSFFARYARDPGTGDLVPGRRYVGVYAPGLGSTQTAQVRTMSSLLQAAKDMDPAQADPWWTLMVFFNSLRELGTSVSLLQSDIPDYLVALHNRRGAAAASTRRLHVVRELTSRLRDDEIPQAIEDLARTTAGSWPVDICLASSIIEVGIDILRLSLMCVVGQPKSTSQYIQVTGRIGRRWPGLVATIYGASKPRDRSHYEQFRAYHSRLYAQVEPVSVTPFAPPVLRRAVHAVLCAFVRQRGFENLAPWPLPEELAEQARVLLEERAASVDPEEYGQLKAVMEQRLQEWRSWERLDWEAKASSTTTPAPLLRFPGRWYPPEVARVSWATPTSLRDVDAECRASITTLYAQPPEGAA